MAICKALAESAEKGLNKIKLIKNSGLDQYGAELYEQQQFETAGVDGG